MADEKDGDQKGEIEKIDKGGVVAKQAVIENGRASHDSKSKYDPNDLLSEE
jgi:hypothetical protein